MPKRKIFLSILAVLFICGFFLENFFSHKYTVPILMYHQVAQDPDPEYRLSVSAKTLNRQLEFLKKNNYNVVSLERLADLIGNKKKIPPRTIAITFDDGYKDNYSNAFPVLNKYNLPVTIFVILQEIGRPDRLSWDEVNIMLDSGFITLGSHAVGPDPLIKIKTESELRKQIFDSKRILEERFKREVPLFSYPEGMFNSHIRQLVIDAGYKLAVATNPGRLYPGDDIFALKRIRISERDKNMFIFWAKASGFYVYFKGDKPKR